MELLEGSSLTFDCNNLLPVLPSNIGRYSEGGKRVTTDHTALSGAMFTSVNSPPPTYLAHGWHPAVHPEGKPYYWMKLRSLLTVITEAKVQDEAIDQQLQGWIDLLVAFVADHGFCSTVNSGLPEADKADSIVTPQDHVSGDNRDCDIELYLKLDSQTGCCNYYFVQHATRTVFWAKSVDTRSLGLEPSVSINHLKHAVEENYWIHVEMFPMHLANFPAEALEDLTAIFLHGLTDQMTSRCSAFPYSQEECRRFLEILGHIKERPFNGYAITCIARLWNNVSNSRFISRYGEDPCRLSRNQTIVEASVREQSKVLSAVSILLFNMPVAMRIRLEGLFVDGFVYKYDWEPQIREIQSEWLIYLKLILGLTICNVLALPRMAVVPFVQASLALCTVSLVITTVLSQRHQGLEKLDAGEAAIFMFEHQTSHGFQSLAMVFSLPKALCTWALALFTIQMFWMILSQTTLPVVLPICAALIVLGFVIWRSLLPRSDTGSSSGAFWSRFCCLRKGRKENSLEGV